MQFHYLLLRNSMSADGYVLSSGLNYDSACIFLLLYVSGSVHIIICDISNYMNYTYAFLSDSG